MSGSLIKAVSAEDFTEAARSVSYSIPQRHCGKWCCINRAWLYCRLPGKFHKTAENLWDRLLDDLIKIQLSTTEYLQRTMIFFQIVHMQNLYTPYNNFMTYVDNSTSLFFRWRKLRGRVVSDDWETEWQFTWCHMTSKCKARCKSNPSICSIWQFLQCK